MGNGDFKIDNFLGGLNEALDEFHIKPNEARSLQNISISDGNMNSCKGSTAFTTATISLAKDNTLMAYYKGSNCYLLAANNGKIYRLDHDINGDYYTLIDQGYIANTFDYVNFNVNDKDLFIFANGLDPVKVYDGAIARDLKNDGYLSAASPTNKAPRGKFIEVHYDRLWLADDNNLYFSTITDEQIDIEDFTAPTAPEEEVNRHGGQISMYTNDGSRIIGLKVVYDDILVFKEKSIFKIFGTSTANYTKIQVFSSNGAIADKSIQTSNLGCYFLNKDGIYLYDGTNCKLVSQKIRNTFANLDVNYISNAQAAMYKNKYIVSVTEKGYDYNNLTIEYDIDSQTFTIRRGIDVSSFIIFSDKLLFVNKDGLILEYNNGTSYNGTRLDAYYETGNTDLGYPDAVKDIETIYLVARGNGDLKITSYTDKDHTGSKFKIVTLNDATSDKVYKVKLKNRGRILRYRIDNQSGSTFSIKSMKIICDLDAD